MKKRFPISALFLIVATTVYAQQAASDIQENIKKMKERLGDRLLTTADEVIAKHVEAVGGREAIQSVKTLMLKARVVYGGAFPNLYRFYQQPNLLRVRTSPGGGSYTLTDGEKVWAVNPEGRRELHGWAAQSLSHHRLDGNFIDYKNRGVKVEYIGLEDFGTGPNMYYHLRRTFPDGFMEELYFDVETGLLIGIRPTSSPQKILHLYYDYKNIGGILLAHMWVTVSEKASPPHILVIEEVRINEDFGEKFFTEYKDKPIQK